MLVNSMYQKLSKQIIGTLKNDSEREFAAMKLLQIQDACEMSGRKTINNRAFRNWNSSIYQYHNRTKEYRIRKDFENKVSYAVPKKIKWD